MNTESTQTPESLGSPHGCAAPRIPTRPRCHRCQRYITIDTHADDDLWEEVIGERFGPGYICADCFTRAADERLIKWEGRLRLVPISLVSQIEIQAEAILPVGWNAAALSGTAYRPPAARAEKLVIQHNADSSDRE